MNIISVFLSNESQMGPLLFWTPLILLNGQKQLHWSKYHLLCSTGKKYGTTRGCINNDCFKRFYLFIFNVEDPGQEFVIINQYYFKVIIIIIIIIIIIAYVFRLNKILNRYKILQMQKIYIPL